MGQSWSSGRRRNRRNRHQNPPLSRSTNSPIMLSPESPPRPPPLPPPSTLPPPPSFAFAANAPYQNPNPMVPNRFPPHFPHPNAFNYVRPMMGQYNRHPYHSIQSNGSLAFQPPPPYVDHESAKKIKNDVNVHKDSIRIVVDEQYPDYHLVSFIFDAMVSGSITIFYFGKEGANCTFTPLYPTMHVPVRIPFQEGLGQKFCQPSGTGIDLGFFELDDLSKPLLGEDVFPLIILAESRLPSLEKDKQLGEPTVKTASHAQITEAVLEKKDDSHFQVKVIKQILWVDGIRYELREIYGISSATEATSSDNDSGKECVICMTEPKDTAVLPCRHMCMCSECAKELRLQSDKCPICRQPISELLEIKCNHDLRVLSGQPLPV
ncbi:probable E3 ubiquitin-protein ligase LUL4 [Actinidia eriantha]|uniref:probable E3 ubiquitin-protein ligase LUL4 n=1 Tax=Actinidia eriantha TaxID=165200 RepID=UPI00258C0F16|nr:probable E3 ubiquitin-protein ligase LUL4 [Actinidia eriantha]